MFQSDKYKIKWDEGDELKQFEEKLPQANNPLYLAKNSLLKNKANYQGYNNDPSIYQNELRKSEELTEEYSNIDNKPPNSNYVSNLSINNTSSNHPDYDPTSPYNCPKHPDRQVEYFCCECYSLVCPKCMFHLHNGHSLSQISPIYSNITENLSSLSSSISSVRK